MIISQPNHLVNIEVIPALTEHELVLANLLELYIHDFSAFIDLEIGADGRFGYNRLPLYWTEANRFPFLIKANGNLAGFILLHRESQISGDVMIWDMAEFFIVRKYRRRGAGMQAAHEIWRRFPGKWEIRVIEVNHAAKKFWAHAIRDFFGKTIPSTLFKKDDKSWFVFSFESKL